MKPYYEHAGITIYHGDCRQVLPQLGRFDLLLTDPPYGLGIDGQKLQMHANGSQRRKGHEFMGWDSAAPTFEDIRAVMDSADVHIIWGGNYLVPHLGVHKGWLVWGKGQDGQLGQSDGELAYTNIDRPLRIKVIHRATLWAESPQHPTQKPLELFQWCIGLVPNVRSLVDPYMGSGTALHAAKELGISATGIDINERYCEIAAQRLSQEVMDFARKGHESD